MTCQFLLSLAIAAVASASPFVAPVAPRADACKAGPINVIVDVLHLFKATAFCSSFLHLPVSTSVSTVTVRSTSTGTASVAVATNSVDTTTIVDIISTTIVTGTNIDYVTTITNVAFSTDVVATTTNTLTTTTLLGVNAKRREVDGFNGSNTFPIPSYLKQYVSSEISSACSCLSLPPSMVKSVVTTTVGVPKTVTASYTSTVSTVTLTSTTQTVDVAAIVTAAVTTTTTEEVDVTAAATTVATASVTLCAYGAQTNLDVDFDTIPVGGGMGIASTPAFNDPESCCNVCATGGEGVSCLSWYVAQGLCWMVEYFDASGGNGGVCPYGTAAFGGYPPSGPSFTGVGKQGPCGT